MKSKAYLFFLLGWCVPGLGHAAQKKFKRALFFFVALSAMSALGLMLGGKIYSFQTDNPLTVLGFLSDIGLGFFYLSSKLFTFGGGNLENITFEFGSAYIAGAGLLNYLIALDAFDIAVGKKK